MTVSDDTVHTSVVVEAITGVSPDVDVGKTAKIEDDHDRFSSEANVIVFEGDFAIVTVCVAVACEYCESPSFVAVTAHVAVASPAAVRVLPEIEQSPVTPYETAPVLEPPEVVNVIVDP